MINRLQFSIDIKAEKTKIWKALWNENSYQNWASVFFEGSYAITDNWKESSKVLFLAPDKSGIYSIIEKHIPNKIRDCKLKPCIIHCLFLAYSENPADFPTVRFFLLN